MCLGLTAEQDTRSPSSCPPPRTRSSLRSPQPNPQLRLVVTPFRVEAGSFPIKSIFRQKADCHEPMPPDPGVYRANFEHCLDYHRIMVYDCGLSHNIARRLHLVLDARAALYRWLNSWRLGWSVVNTNTATPCSVHCCHNDISITSWRHTRAGGSGTLHLIRDPIWISGAFGCLPHSGKELEDDAAGGNNSIQHRKAGPLGDARALKNVSSTYFQ